ncbi:imidazole glycerol phosphate synthase subunit HisH [Gracilibacillus halophilus YIM-C55.5]|uniref:Imidazole glycerol phosphate synthase subunit HisH n=1 Tax=Gracilibacillus halophilus YIM-C55.5 TaxID=1308866 RepID=N4WLE1_9BACI|nr:imidazole glycerol phosphate synthase subunit HisH [Gracilibacillus halophilus]ENH96987.1 imidazole glycerol phosphate synthase subunit HisH [Gracilibacillus halophilus YIM-C55.5]
MIAIVDYGMGNVASVKTAFQNLGYQVTITDDIEELQHASHIILPGVGSFKAAVEEIRQRQLLEALQQLATEKPFLGICLGMQLLFERGYENGESDGLAIIPGTVEQIETDYLLPHIGWNQLQVALDDDEWNQFEGNHVYFVHTYQAVSESKYLVATTDYGTTIPAIVQKGNVYGMQFHPEKSSEVGVQLLKKFMELTT